MKVVSLSEQECAKTGYTHVAHFKVTAGDLDATADFADVIAVPIGSVIAKVAFHIVTIWDKVTTISVGVAASGGSATTFLNAQTIGTGGANGTTLGSAATTLTVNNTASRFITITATVTAGPATAGEGYLYIHMTDHAAIKQPLF